MNGGKVTSPISVTESNYKSEDVAHLSEVVVATYTTQFNQNVAGRTKNIELSAQAINNVIIGTNDFFSFNTTVGPSDELHGYTASVPKGRDATVSYGGLDFRFQNTANAPFLINAIVGNGCLTKLKRPNNMKIF